MGKVNLCNLKFPSAVQLMITSYLARKNKVVFLLKEEKERILIRGCSQRVCLHQETMDFFLSKNHVIEEILKFFVLPLFIILSDIEVSKI